MILKSFLPLVTKSHVERRILPTHPSHLFGIICDVDQYSKFLPLCSHSQVLSRSRDGRSFQASLTVGIPPLFVETYTSHVTVDPRTWTVETRSIESRVLESLHSKWQLHDVSPAAATSASSTTTQGSGGEPAAASCRVDFWVEMSVRDPVVGAALDQLLEQVARQQVEAFADRCRHMVPTITGDAAQR